MAVLVVALWGFQVTRGEVFSGGLSRILALGTCTLGS